MSLAIAATVYVASTAYSAYNGYQANKQQRKAQKRAEVAAAEQARRAEQDFNRANRKSPNVSALLGANQQAASRGVGSTMLTGSGGVDSGSLSLGRSTLLGQ